MGRKKGGSTSGPVELVLCRGSRHVIPASMIGSALTAWLDEAWSCEIGRSIDGEEGTSDERWDVSDDWVSFEMGRLSDEVLRMVAEPRRPERWVSFVDASGEVINAGFYPRGDLALLLFRAADSFGAYLTQILVVCPELRWSDDAVGEALGLRLVDSPIEQIRDQWTGLLLDSKALTLEDLEDSSDQQRLRTTDGIVVNT